MAAEFKGTFPYVMEIDGTMNGVPFQVVGNGTGNAEDGKLKGNYHCTSGDLPLSFAALASTCGYGFKCFLHYPDNITNFFHLSFPNGYSQVRTIKFQSGGVITAVHTITLSNNTVYNKVKFTATDFAANSPVVTKNIKMMLPTTEYTYPYENGVRSLVYHVFPLINGEGFEVAEQITVNKPLGKASVSLPEYHHMNVEIKQTKVNENSMEQEEVGKAYILKLM